MKVYPHSPVTKYLLQSEHRWTLEERRLLAQSLNGAVQHDGNVRFTGVLGKPENIAFNRYGVLWAFTTTEQSYLGENAAKAIMSRMYWIGLDLFRHTGKFVHA